jgi:hypothetical protein
MVISERIFIQVLLQVLRANASEHAANTILDHRPEAFNRIGMNITDHVNIIGVQNLIMLVSHSVQAVVNRIFVCVDLRALLDLVFHKRENGRAFGIRNGFDLDFTFAFNNTHNRSFILRAAPALATSVPTTKITFVNLDLTAKRVLIFVKAFANFVAHAPSSLVGHARFSLNLLCANSTTRLCHQVAHIKPSGQRGAGFVEYCSSARENVIPAFLATI